MRVLCMYVCVCGQRIRKKKYVHIREKVIITRFNLISLRTYRSFASFSLYNTSVDKTSKGKLYVFLYPHYNRHWK